MDDACCRVLTSGSTGAPHPVGLTYGNFLWSAVGSGFNIGVEPRTAGSAACRSATSPASAS